MKKELDVSQDRLGQSMTDPDETLFRILACAEMILDGDDKGESIHADASIELASKVFELHDWLRSNHKLPSDWKGAKR